MSRGVCEPLRCADERPLNGDSVPIGITDTRWPDPERRRGGFARAARLRWRGRGRRGGWRRAGQLDARDRAIERARRRALDGELSVDARAEEITLLGLGFL